MQTKWILYREGRSFLYIEEADTHIIPHINEALSTEFTRFVVKSNNTDVFVLLLHYTYRFKERGLKELWLQYGTGSRIQFISIHTLHEKIGNDLSLLTLKLHVLTGCDVTSSIGTKNSTFKVKSECYLRDFGERLHLREEDAEAQNVTLWRL